MKTYPGVIDGIPFPARLTAHVVEPAPDPRLHGFAIQSDLAQHVGFLDVGWLALTGELPSDAEREALSRALTMLAPLHAGEGPAHAAILAKISGAPEELVPAITTVAIGQLVATEHRALAPLFAWLEQPVGMPVPIVAIETSPTSAQREAHAALAMDSARWFGDARALPAEPVLGRVAAAYALLHRLGIRDLPRIHAFVTWARLPVVLAEAACTARGAVMTYPTDLPPYRYVEEEVA